MTFVKYLHRILLCSLLSLGYIASSFSISAASKNPFVVVIDAGHGGKDVGAVDNGVKEKDINLGVALELGDLIKKKMKDAKVVYTRTDDTYLTLQQRADKANSAKGNLFISIHTNSLDANNPKRKTVEGSSVYVLGLHKDDSNMRVAQRENAVIKLESDYKEKYEGFDPQRDESYIIFEMAQKKNLSYSIKFAEEAEKQLVNIAKRKGRGVHQAGFWVLWATAMPGALVEVDFICNPKSAEFIGGQSGQKKLAEALFRSVENYRKELKLAERQPKKKIETIVPADGNAVTLAASTGSTKVKSDAPAIKARSKSTGKRRRRSESARRISESRNFETDFIAVNTHSEFGVSGGITTIVEETSSEPVQTADTKNKKKNKKKDRKVNPKKAKKQSANTTRTVNGKEVVIGRNDTSRKSAKENSEHAQKGSRAVRKKSIGSEIAAKKVASDEPQSKAAKKIRKEQEAKARKEAKQREIAAKEAAKHAAKEQEMTKTDATSSRLKNKKIDIDDKKNRSVAAKENKSDSKSVNRRNNVSRASIAEQMPDVKVKNAFSSSEKKNIKNSEKTIDPDSRLNRGSRRHRSQSAN